MNTAAQIIKDAGDLVCVILTAGAAITVIIMAFRGDL